MNSDAANIHIYITILKITRSKKRKQGCKLRMIEKNVKLRKKMQKIYQKVKEIILKTVE